MKKIITEAGKVNIEALKKAVSALESPKTKRAREREALFAELYEIIRDQINADVSKSTIIKTLTEQGFSIGNSVFDELLEAEAKRRGEPVPGKDDEAGEDEPVSVNTPPNAPQAGAKEEVVTQ